MVMEMLRAAEVREDDDCYQSPLDELFERLEMKNPDHIAVKYYSRCIRRDTPSETFRALSDRNDLQRTRRQPIGMERQQIYFRGHTDAVAYLRKIKVI